MEGRASNFDDVLAEFKERLPHADFVTVDLKLTGVDFEEEVDDYLDTVACRYKRLCRIAEQYTPMQIGFTLGRVVESSKPGGNSQLELSSYNIYCFPHVGTEPGDDPCFFCRASALQFNASHNLDFNAWIKDGVRYMRREDEQRYLATPESQGLLRLWKSLCEARLPLVVHGGPMDLLFLLRCFECKRLPQSEAELSALVQKCFPCVFDTAHLHTAVGLHFNSKALMPFLEEARARHAQMVEQGLPPLNFVLEPTTEKRYGCASVAHEAGYDSLATAELFTLLVSMAPDQVLQGEGRQFLYRSKTRIILDAAKPSVAAALCSKLSGQQVGADDESLESRLLRSDMGSPTGTPPSTPVSFMSPVSASSLELDSACQSSPIVMGREPCSQRSYFHGQVKCFYPDKGYGFVTCLQSLKIYGRDVFLHSKQLGDCTTGDWIKFTVDLNARGQPQARGVRRLSCPLSATAIAVMQSEHASDAPGDPRGSGSPWLSKSSCSSQEGSSEDVAGVGAAPTGDGALAERANCECSKLPCQGLGTDDESRLLRADMSSSTATPPSTPASSMSPLQAPSPESSPTIVGREPRSQQSDFHGQVKCFFPEKGYGFVTCLQTFKIYGRDVFLHSKQLGDFATGDWIKFTMDLNARGQPQARGVRRLSCPPSATSVAVMQS